MAQFSFASPPESGISEDCLYLNIWAPEGFDSKGQPPLPVLFWIYGGGHRVGSASHPSTWGEKLAARGAIVVAANYRLGALGYLAHPALTAEAGASGNYASLDLIAALDWVRGNIEAFGGDRDRITLYGQSAGAAQANVLMASPLATGLFQRAIVVSGGRMAGGPMGRLKPLNEAERDGADLMARLGADDLEAMRALPASRFADIPMPWNLVVDGVVSTAQPEDRFAAGAHHPVPLLAGFALNDAAPYPSPQWATVAGLREFAATFGARANDLLDLYPASTDAEALAQSYRIRRDVAFAYQPWRQAETMAAGGSVPSWMFCLEQAPPLPVDRPFHEPTPPGGFGVYHGADIWYAFGNFDAVPWQWTAPDQRVHETLADAFVRFAADGDPGAVSGLAWPQLGEHDRALRLSDRPVIETLPNRAELRFFKDAFLRSRA